MNLDMGFYLRVAAIGWFSHCGETLRPDLGFPVHWVESGSTALQSMFSTQWSNAVTYAKGRLTSHLAKQNYNLYGTTWNKLAKESQAILETAICGRLSDALKVGGWAEGLAQTTLPTMTRAVRASLGPLADLLEAKAWDQCLFRAILVDINLAALELTYRRKFPKAPIFFERLLQVYEAGRLPCGWEGDLDMWPEGKLMVY